MEYRLNTSGNFYRYIEAEEYKINKNDNSITNISISFFDEYGEIETIDISTSYTGYSFEEKSNEGWVVIDNHNLNCSRH